MSATHFLARVVPAIGWARKYSKADFAGDLQAGLTTAVMLIPQGMAYAMLAGLPPQVGLYAATVPLVLYAIFGTSRHLAVGPVAMVSLLVAGALSQIPAAQADPAMYVGLAVILMAMTGIVQLVMGVARLGFLVNFLSHPVIAGFTYAAALIIGLSQLKHLMGVNLAGGEHVHEILFSAVARIGETNLPTLAIGAVSIAILVLLRRWKKTFPAALAVVGVSTLAVWGFGWADVGVKIVKDVPAGLPSPAFPAIAGIEGWGGGWALAADLWPTAIVISLVGYMESIAVAKAFATKNKYKIDANQELIGLGAANFGGAFFGGYPVTGGFSRTAVNAQAGAKTGLAAIITAAIVTLTLFLFTPLFYFLPKAVLAAIIMVAVFGLIDVREAVRIAKLRAADGFLLGLTFVATLAIGIEQGIAIGVAASLLMFILKSTRPHLAVLGRLPGTDVYRNVKRFPEAVTEPGLLAVRIDAPFYFGNVAFLHESLADLEAESKAPIEAVVIDATSINDLDSSAADALMEIADDYESRRVRLYFAGVKGPVRDMMERVGLCRLLGPDRFFARICHAVTAWHAECAKSGGAALAADEVPAKNWYDMAEHPESRSSTDSREIAASRP